MDCDAQLAYSRQLWVVFLNFDQQSRSHWPSFWCAIRNQDALVGVCVHDHKSLCAAVMICTTQVDIQTRAQTAFGQLI